MHKTCINSALSLMFLAASVVYGQSVTNLTAANQPHGATPSVGTQQPLAPPGEGGGGAPADIVSRDDDKPPSIRIEALTLPPIPIPRTSQSDEEKRVEQAKEAPTVKSARLGDSIVLRTGKGQLQRYVQWATAHARDLTLYVNGNDTNLRPEAIDLGDDTLQFHLERTAENKKLWSALLRQPFRYETRYGVKASVSIDHREAVPSDATFNLLVVTWTAWAKTWLVLLVVFAVLLIVLSWKKGLLRDGPPIGGANQPYSLGLCQMAWWFFLIIASYVFIWLICGDQDTITPSLLGLMGISAGTALGAKLIETSTAGSGSLSQAASDRIAYQAALSKAELDLQTAGAAATAAPADAATQHAAADARAAVDVVTQKLSEASARLDAGTRRPVTSFWLREILSDSNGQIALHRLQIVVWTVVLGIMFLVSVLTELTMPEFNATLLATMGISAGTYLGFKFPEK
jgi:hypothetical protein